MLFDVKRYIKENGLKQGRFIRVEYPEDWDSKIRWSKGMAIMDKMDQMGYDLIAFPHAMYFKKREG